MWLTNVSIRRPIFIIMFVLALIVMGYQSRSKMPAELNPKIDFPYITVQTVYAGAGPSELETLVSEPIEKAVASIGNLRDVTSSSQDGVSVVVLEFELGTNVDSAAADVRDKVAAIRASLPRDMDDPVILKLDIASEPIMTIGLSGPLSPKEMRILADDVITDKLAKIGGVAAVNVTGGQQREISVAVDKGRLQAYSIGLDKIVNTIKAANLNVPAGSIKQGSKDYSIRTVGEFRRSDEVANVRLHVAGKNGGPDANIPIGDVAVVKDTVAEQDHLSQLDGKPAVLITIQKQSDANTVAVAEGVKRELEDLKPALPSGVETIVAVDQSTFVEDSLHDVNTSLMEGVLLVVLIVFLFLHSIRATFIVAVAIPTSIMATYLPIHSFGFTLNTMTMLALSLVVGILVDDSIVVLENIERHIRLRERPAEAALNGRSEIGLAAIAITFVDIVVFVPIAFMGGIVGQFFRQFGITVAVATAFSLFMSFTLTPMLASRWMKSEDENDREKAETMRRIAEGTATPRIRVNWAVQSVFSALERLFDVVDRQYHYILEWALHNRFMVWVIGGVSLFVVLAIATPNKGAAMGFRVVVALLALGLSAAAMAIDKSSRKTGLIFGPVMAFIALVIYLPFGFNFFPDMDRGFFSVSLRTAPGTSLAATESVVREVEAVVSKIPELKPVYAGRERVIEDRGYYMSYVGMSSAGHFGGSDVGSQYARIDVQLVDRGHRKRSLHAIVDDVARRLSSIPGAERMAVAVSSSGGPSSGITMEVQGQRMSDILEQAELLKGIMEKTPGAVDVDISYKASRPERRIIVDRVRAAYFDMSVAQVAAAARTALDGDDTAKFRDGDTEYPIRVRFAQADRAKPSDVEDLIIGSRDGAPIYLRDVARVEYDNAPTKIDRKNRQRVVYVTANLATGAAQGNVEQMIKQALAKTQTVPGTTVTSGGMGKIMMESFGYMGSAMMLAILLVYMLMGALFESFLTPFVIMFSLPQAVVGALLALLLTGNTLSMVAMIGIIMLMGLVTKNAILLIDYTNTLMSRGMGRHEAILEAGPTRLRPILMTTFAMIGGMAPTALAVSRGSEMRAPMAIAVIGGLIMSTLLTLIVIPVTYTIVDDVWHWIMRTVAPGSGRKVDAGAENSLELTSPPTGADPE